jgi:transcriptional regulator with XRE-family HTH domain
MTKPAQKNTKTHATGAELKLIREKLGFAPRDMRSALGITSRRTYEDYEAGKRKVPLETLRLARNIWQDNQIFWKRLPGILSRKIDREFPGGIPGTINRSFNED